MKRQSQLSFVRQALSYMVPADVRVPVIEAMRTRPYRKWSEHGWHAEDAAIECWRLKTLNAFDDGLHERINRRGRILAHMQAVAKDGMVKFVESGRDCDCVDYVHPDYEPSPATLLAYWQREKRMHEGAEGPCHLSIVPPDEKVKQVAHDRVLEAFEDGHPHVVYSSHGG